MTAATRLQRIRSIDEVLAEARSRITRLLPEEAAARVAARALLVDIRPAVNRAEEGGVPGALVIERNVLEWRLDPQRVMRGCPRPPVTTSR